MIVFSDLHLDEDSADVVLGTILPGIFDAARRLGDSEIACLGDFWHLRYKIDVKLQNAVRDELMRWVLENIRIYVLPGNHDQVDVHGRNAMEVFDGLGRRCQVFTTPTWTKHGLWVPYRKHQSDIEVTLKKNPDGDMPRPAIPHANVVWMHQGLQGAWKNDQVRDTDGLPLSMLSQFDAVICGHYHKRQKLGNVYYVGSPRQVTANEAGQDKGFAVWNGKQLTYVMKRWGKRFHRVRLERGDKLQVDDFSTGDEVRVTTAEGVDFERVGQALASMGVQHTVTPDVPAAERRLDVEVNASLDDYAQEYVKTVPTTLDRDRLLQVFGELRL